MKHIAIFFVLTLFLSAPSFSEDSIEHLLFINNTSKIEKLLMTKQLRFERGEISEVELRDSYRPFYVLDERSKENLISWARNDKSSYVAHLGLGIHYKKFGQGVRGAAYSSKTAPDKLKSMRVYFDLARLEFNISLKLTAKPYLTIYHLLDLSKFLGDDELSKKMELEGAKVYPQNELMRYRYATTLLPRWGGTYELFSQYLSDVKVQGAPSYVLKNLESMMHSDKGFRLEEDGDIEGAHDEYKQALQLGKNGSGTFREDYLKQAKRFFCSYEVSPPFCVDN